MFTGGVPSPRPLLNAGPARRAFVEVAGRGAGLLVHIVAGEHLAHSVEPRGVREARGAHQGQGVGAGRLPLRGVPLSAAWEGA